MLRFGPETGPVVVVAMPLFEEANRMRTFAVTLCRALAKRGVASVLPDLPGQGESLSVTADLTIDSLFGGYLGVLRVLEVEDRTPYAVSIRSGAIIDVVGVIPSRWHLSPSSGPELARDLLRIRQTGSLAKAVDSMLAAPIDVAGNLVSLDLLESLGKADIFRPADGVSIRVVRLESDTQHADLHVSGAPLWRRAEPDNDPSLAALLANDIADWVAGRESDWIAACEG